MSTRIEKSFLSIKDIEEIKNDCFVEGCENTYGPASALRAYGETTNSLYIPFAYSKKRFGESPNKDIDYPQTTYSFYIDRFPYRTDGGRDQKQVFEEAIKMIRIYRSVLLSLFCAYGKTFLGIKLAHQSKLKTAVLTHRGILIDQWEESIQKFTNAIVQRVDTDGVLDPHADFYLFNIAFVHKKWNKSTKSWQPKKLNIFRSIGMLIVDEAHIACAEDISRALLYFNPRINVALTATPVRKDGMDKALELYFGDYSVTRIIRIAQNPFTVYRLPTNIKPDFVQNKFGKKDWNSVIKSLVENKQRNRLIIDLIKKFNTHNILILTKRKEHCNFLSRKLTKLGITNTVMIGTQKKYDKTARVLLSTYSKLGVGFDDTRLNMLIVACSVTEVEQYAGRLRDGIDKQRIIVDLVDNDSNCLKHWQERRKWYISRNGKVKNYYQVFKDENSGPDPEKEQTEYGIKPIGEQKRLARRI